MVEDSPIVSPKESGQKRTTRRDLPTGTVTLLFTDIEGSTLLLQQLGERYSNVLNEYRDLLRAAFSEHNGHEVDTQGDVFFVIFVRARDAILATVAAQRALTTHSWPEGVVVRVRMGLHTCEPPLVGESYVGLDAHYAARIAHATHGGQVLLSQTTYDLIESELPFGVSLRDLGNHRLKDLLRPAHLYQLVIVGLTDDFPLLKTLDSRPNNLPVQLTALIGREKEVAAVQYLLQREDVRLATLTGPGGMGKTRLGLQVAAELSDLFADGVYFVNLAPLSDPELVVPTIAQALGLEEVSGQSLFDLVSAWLREKYLLLLLDNFEQVVDAAVHVADILVSCPNLKVLVTSRMTLHIRGEQEFSVPPLTMPDPKRLPDLVELPQYEAVALFVSRAQATKPTFQLTASNALAIAEICVRLDGLPLAIELAATRIRLFSPQSLLVQLGQRLDLLTRGALDAPARQRTLRDTIAWSYHLLDESEQQLFRRIAVFVGGCTLAAIEAVCAEPGDAISSVMDGVESLIDKNLLQQTAQEEEEPRLRMLETIREYGLEVLSVNGEMESTRQAHAKYYLQLAEEAKTQHDDPQQVEWLERLEREHDNLRSAMEWLFEPTRAGSLFEMAYQLAAALTEFWNVRGFNSEARDFLERVLARSEGVAVSLRAKMLDAAASFADEQGDWDRAETLWQESLALYRELGDIRGIASSLKGVGMIAEQKGEHIAGLSLMEESLALTKEAGDLEATAWSLLSLADKASSEDYQRGYSLAEESLAIFRELGNKKGIALCLNKLALILVFSAKWDQANVHQWLEESLVIFRELGDKQGLAWNCWVKGWVAFKQGDTVNAHDLIERALALDREMGMRWHTPWALAFLGRIKAQQGDFAGAHTLLEESLAEARTLDDWVRAMCLERLAVVVAAQAEYPWTVRLLSVAASLREHCGIPAWPIERTDFEPAMIAARTSLGEKAFVSAWAEGQNLSFEQVLTIAGRSATTFLDFTEHVPKAIRKQTTFPAGLTTREVEVLRLVAQGLSNVEIAEQLVISLLTVKAHMRSLYNKLGISSRSAATRYAIEHQLV